MASVHISSSRKSFVRYESLLFYALHDALTFLKKNNAHVEVFLVSRAEIQRVNCECRGKNTPTTVLSFPFDKPFPGFSFCLGEIYLAPQEIRLRGEDIVFLVIHGLLHLLGYTHSAKHDTIDMKNMEREILACIQSTNSSL